jgi:hypothetical protein
MTNPTIKIHNTETNEIIEREMTDQEISHLNPVGVTNEAATK